MMLRALPLGILLALGTITRVASAQAMEPVTVTSQPTTVDPTANLLALRDGSAIRARIADLRPGQYVIVTLPEGNRTIAWTDIVHAEGPSFPGGYNAGVVYGAALTVTQTGATTDYLHPEPGRVPLVVESAGPPMQIGESFTSGVGNAWGSPMSRPVGRLLCTTPCTLYVWPSTFTLQSTAPGFRTNVVAIPVPQSGLRVRLRASSRGAFYGGAGAAVGGGFVLLTGASFMIYAAALDGARSSYFSTPSPTGFYVAGGVTLGIGVVGIVIGAIVMSANRSGLDSSTPLPTSTSPQLSFGASPDGVSASVTAHF